TVIDTVLNILIGDVWVCSGQSNMWMPMKPVFIFPGADNNKTEIAAANYPNIRYVNINENPQSNPLEKLGASTGWQICSAATAPELSAAAYYFGRKLHTTLNVPIGLVVAAVSGTRCEEWTSTPTISGNPTLNSYFGSNTKKSKLYNGMIYPIRKFAIKGFTWYQGEENVKDDIAANYTTLNSAMIGNWRSIFNDANLPFYFTQIAPFNFNENNIVIWDKAARLRQAQAAVRKLNTPEAPVAMAVTMDIGQFNNVHPGAKKPVGERLAALALNITYKKADKYLGPQIESGGPSGNSIVLTFKNAEGLTTKNGAAINQDFYIAGINKVFYKAKATIVNGKIVLTSTSGYTLAGIKPVAIRYCYNNLNEDNNINTTLQNQYGFPMEPFRTDDW
ncbi:MAG: 9-O-acetylesterase, partial [Sphingobacteriaceae bacterium]